MLRLCRRFLAAVLSACVIVISPGLESYRAFGAQFSKAPEAAAPAALPAIDVSLPKAQIPAIQSLGTFPIIPAIGAADLNVAPPAAPGAVAPRQTPAQARAYEETASPAAAASPTAEAVPQAQAERTPAQRLEAVAQTVGQAVEELARPGLTPEAAHRIGRRLEGERGAPNSAAEPELQAEPRPLKRFTPAPAAWKGISWKGIPLKALKRGALVAIFAGVLSHSGRATAQSNPAPVVITVPAPTSWSSPLLMSFGPVTASIEVDRQGVTVGERVHLAVILTNNTDKPITINSLRESLDEALPDDLELEGTNGNAPIVIAPGQTYQEIFEVIPFNSGDLKLDSKLNLSYSTPDDAGVAQAQTVVVQLPAAAVHVQTVLTADWQKKGLKDIDGIMRRETSQLYWLAGIPLLLLLMIGAERILAARRDYPKAEPAKLPLLEETRGRIAALENPTEPLGAVRFYGEVYDVLEKFMVDYHGLPVRERDAKELLKDLKASGKFASGQLEVAKLIAQRAEAVRFGGEADEPVLRARALNFLKALVDSVAGGQAPEQAPQAKPGMLGILGVLPAAAALQFGSPWALWLFVPFGAYVLWNWLRRRAAAAREAYALSASDALPKQRGLRARLTWLPRFLRIGALALVIGAIARPQLGITRSETYVPSTDTMLEFDLSASMSGSFRTGSSGPGPSKLEAAVEAGKAYIDEQRRGTTNRVGIGTFSDDAYQDVRLTNDYDALIAHLKELQVSGNTAIGKAMLGAIAHFMEINALELDEQSDPRVERLKEILKRQGLPAALEFAKPYPDLMDKVVRPDRKKVVILFTDGESNAGIKPLDAAVIAKKLGVRVYTIGIAPTGQGSVAGFDEKTLQAVAAETGAQYFRADDAGRMREVLLEIDRLEKSPSKIVSTVSVKEYGQWLALLALLALGFEVLLANTRLRTLQGLVFLALPWSFNPGLPPALKAPSAAVAPASTDVLPVKGVPDEVAAANLLYNQGRYDEALRAYARALELYPDYAETYFNMGNTYYRLGDGEGAQASYKRYLALISDPVVASRVFFNMGNAAIIKHDGDQAIEMYMEALRRNPDNAEAKWNLEILKKLQQQAQGQGQGRRKKGHGQGQGQGQQPGQPGPAQPQPGQPGADNGKSGVDSLSEQLRAQGKTEDEATRKNITRKGHGTWGLLALPALFGAGVPALTFGSPLLLWSLAFLVPLVMGLLAYGLHKRLSAARTLSPATAPKTFRSWWGKGRALTKAALLIATVGLLGVAASDPKSGTTVSQLNFGGKDIEVAVDVSHSMIYAEDGRLDRMKAELHQFAARLKGGDRVGLVVFAGGARTASPLSIDYENFAFKIERLEIEARGLPEGSKLAEAVKFGSEAFETVKPLANRERVMILVSDGDIFGSEIETAVKEAKKHGVTIYTIGVGSLEGTTMRVPTADGGGTELIYDDRTGLPATTSLHQEPLCAIANRTGGECFVANSAMSMDTILQRVAAREKGGRGDYVKSPRGVAGWFLVPALLFLLLELALAGRSPVRPEAPKPGKGRKSGKGGAPLAGGALFGLFSLPLHAWALLLPFAVLFAAAAAVILAEVVTRGGVTRRARWAWQRGQGLVAKGVRADAGRLWDLRPIDGERLSAFLAAWEKGPKAARRGLLEDAAGDEQLWRQKLVLAYLHGADPASAEAALTALAGIAAKTPLEPLAPVIAEVLARRGSAAWLDHVDAARRLARLAALVPAESDPELKEGLKALADFPDAEASEAARAALGRTQPPVPPRRSWANRAALGAAALLAAGSLTFAGASGVKTVEYRGEQARKADESLRDFYKDDMFIFSDRYSDPRIADEVLPALRRWNDESGGAAEDLDNAVAVLSQSPDPRAQNILEAMFKRADVLPLSERGQNLLLAILVVQDDAAVWTFMEGQMEQTAGNPLMSLRFQKMIAIAAAAGNERTFQNIFHFLKSPDSDVRSQAAQSIFRSLTSPRRKGEFFDRLLAVQGRFAADPVMNLWVERFELLRVSTAPREDLDLAKARDLVEQILDAAPAFDARRAQALMAAKPGDKLPEAYLAAVLELMDKAEKRFTGAASPAPVPEPLSALVRFAVNQAAARLIREGEKDFPGLHQRLLKAKIVLPDNDRFDPFTKTKVSEPNYRSIYKLGQLRVFHALLAEIAASSPTLPPAQAEFLDRADHALTAMGALGAASGMFDGGSVAERAAEEINVVMGRGYDVFASDTFLVAARAAGLAPDNGAAARDEMWREAYGAEDLKKLRGFLVDAARSGKAWGSAGAAAEDLSWEQKKYLAGAIGAVDAVLKKYYPGDAPPAQGGFWRALEAPGEENLALARLELAAGKDDAGLQFELKAVRYVALRLKGPRGAAEAVDAERTLAAIFLAADKLGGFTAAWSVFSDSLSGADQNGALAAAARAMIQEVAVMIAGGAAEAFPGLRDRFVAVGVRENAYSDRPRYKLIHLKRMLAAIEAEAAKTRASGKPLSEKQAQALQAARVVLPRLSAAGLRAGVPDGVSPADQVAGPVNDILLDGYRLFTGTTFTDALRAAGLAPGGTENLADRYSREDLVKVRKFLQDLLDGGQGWENAAERRPLETAEKDYLASAISSLDSIIADYPKAAKPAGLRGLAPLGLALALPALGPWAWAAAAGGLFLIAAAVAAWWLWGRGKAAPRASAAGASSEVLSRYRRIQIAARKLANAMPGGDFRSRYIGPGGSDVAESNPYDGEELRDVDWKATAKHGEVFAKKYELEKDMAMLLVVDLSPSEDFGSGGTAKKTVLQDSAAAVILAAARVGMRVGAVLVTDQVEAYLPPKRGLRGARQLASQIMGFVPQGRGSDLRPALELVLRSIHARALVAVLSDFLAPDFEAPLAAAAARHDLRPLRVLDPAELKPLPEAGLVRVKDAETGRLRMVDTSSAGFRRRQAALLARREQALAQTFERTGLKPIVLSTESDYLSDLELGFQKRKRPH